MGLLKTVFEVNLTLFQNASTKPNRSRILFVIRDHIGTTPLANLQATVVANLGKVSRESLSKPPPAANSSLDDFFDLQFYALPHKILMPEQFSASIPLSQYFTDPSSSSYVFKPEYHRRVPIDGWPIYSEKISEQMRTTRPGFAYPADPGCAFRHCEEIADRRGGRSKLSLTQAKRLPTTVSVAPRWLRALAV